MNAGSEFSNIFDFFVALDASDASRFRFGFYHFTAPLTVSFLPGESVFWVEFEFLKYFLFTFLVFRGPWWNSFLTRNVFPCSVLPTGPAVLLFRCCGFGWFLKRFPMCLHISNDSFSPFFECGGLSGCDVNHCPALLPFLSCPSWA